MRSIRRYAALAFVLLIPFATPESSACTNTIWKISWSPDGTQVAVGKATGVWIYTVELELATHIDIPFTDGLAWSPDGSKLAVGVNAPGTFYPNWAIQIWDVASLTLVTTGVQERAEWFSLSWNPDGTRLAIANGRLYIWEVGNGQDLVALEGSAPIIHTVTWSPDGNYLASTGSDRAVTIWDVASQTIMLTLEGAGWDTPAVWSEDSEHIAVAYDVDVTIWNISTGQLVTTLPGEGLFTHSIDWRADTLVTANPSSTPYGTSNVYVWNTENGQLLNTIEEDANVFAVALSPDGTQLAYGGQSGTLEIAEPIPTNIPPEADAGPDQTVTASSGGTASVTLDGSGSSDSDGTITAYRWTENDALIAEG